MATGTPEPAVGDAQARERKRPGLPVIPGSVERRASESVRHGDRGFILSRDVVSG